MLPRRPDELEDLGAVGDDRATALAEEVVDALRRVAGDRPRDAHHVTAQGLGPTGGVERTAAQGRLDHHGAGRHRCDEPVAGQEPGPGRRRPGGLLGDDGELGGEVLEQGTVLCG